MNETPAQLGYRLPAEWEPHAATWLGWPRNRDDWPGKFSPIRWVYTEIVRILSRQEPVRILVHDGDSERDATKRLERSHVDLGRVEFLRAKMDRSWVRDSLPTFVIREGEMESPDRVAAIDWGFNAWAKYDNHRRDAKLGRKVCASFGLPRWEPLYDIEGVNRPIVLEGGAIDGNGQGVLLTTEECLLSEVQERNLGLDREAYEHLFREYLGIRKVIWLGRGIAGDDTHGHVDDLARFVNPSTIVLAVEDDPTDANYDALQENRERLESATDAEGNAIQVVTLPMPRPVLFRGERLPASYANFYIANGVVIVPTFNDPADRKALGILAELFPEREVVGIHARDLVWGLGTLHCLTHEHPA